MLLGLNKGSASAAAAVLAAEVEAVPEGALEGQNVRELVK
jgi:hypothetical protein